MNLTECVRNFGDSLRVIGKDFIKGKTFWLPVVLAILPSVLLATKFRSNMPQLVVTAELVRQQYALKGQVLQDREEFLQGVKAKIESMLSARVAMPFSAPPASPPRGGADIFSDWDAMPVAVYTVKAKVTNLGTLSSTISFVSVRLIQSVGGRMSWLGYAGWPKEDAKLPQGQSAILGNPAGQPIEFKLFGSDLLDFQVVEVIGRGVREHLPKDARNRPEILASFLRLFALNNSFRQEHLVSIADPEKQARVFVVIEVEDVYGRKGLVECPVIDYGAWK
jgi:hypothetical protein